MKDRYTASKGAKIKDTCLCPSCGVNFTKKSYQQAFCSNKGPHNCKDVFWNHTVQGRMKP